MTDKTWIDVALTAIAALPGVIAAVSSLRNGRTLKQNGRAADDRQKRSHTKTSAKGTGSGGDWYKPPDV